METSGKVPRRVLVVEDDPLVADSIRRMLVFDWKTVRPAITQASLGQAVAGLNARLSGRRIVCGVRLWLCSTALVSLANDFARMWLSSSELHEKKERSNIDNPGSWLNEDL